jgi:hypothetical protein
MSQNTDKYNIEISRRGNMLLAILTLITALSISAVAIYYSVAGLVAIFAAAALPIMIMGGVLEVGKLVTAVWLHKYWKKASWWLKGYLSVAVFVLMLITSMGIFGFLSKAHIEQTSAGEESVAQVERIDDEITRYISVIGRAENKIRELESSTFNNDSQIQEQIDKEQTRIDTAYDRINPAIKEQNDIIANVTQLFQNELDKIDADLETLQGYVDNGEVKKAQQMIGASADGIFGKKTAEKIGDWKDEKKEERAEWVVKIQEAASSPTVIAAREEIKRLRTVAEDNIKQSNELINRLRSKLGTDDVNLDELLDEQFERVRTANAEIEVLTDEKFELEAEYRKLEAEVGPIKYIAEFVYGEQADRNMLEEAVRWVIITIIFVFDPLAVLLLIASQYTFEWGRKRKPALDNDEWKDYERMRAEVISSNVPPSFEPEKEPEEIIGDTEDKLPEVEDLKEVDPEPKKKDIKLSEESVEDRQKKLDEQDTQDWENAKQAWKDENPALTLKIYKQLYLEGKIDELPWEKHFTPQKFMIKDNNKQIKLETEPQQEQPSEGQGYIQNEEQNSSDSKWKNIRPKDE